MPKTHFGVIFFLPCSVIEGINSWLTVAQECFNSKGLRDWWVGGRRGVSGFNTVNVRPSSFLSGFSWVSKANGGVTGQEGATSASRIRLSVSFLHLAYDFLRQCQRSLTGQPKKSSAVSRTVRQAGLALPAPHPPQIQDSRLVGAGGPPRAGGGPPQPPLPPLAATRGLALPGTGLGREKPGRGYGKRGPSGRWLSPVGSLPPVGLAGALPGAAGGGGRGRWQRDKPPNKPAPSPSPTPLLSRAAGGCQGPGCCPESPYPPAHVTLAWHWSSRGRVNVAWNWELLNSWGKLLKRLGFFSFEKLMRKKTFPAAVCMCLRRSSWSGRNFYFLPIAWWSRSGLLFFTAVQYVFWQIALKLCESLEWLVRFWLSLSLNLFSAPRLPQKNWETLSSRCYFLTVSGLGQKDLFFLNINSGMQ